MTTLSMLTALLQDRAAQALAGTLVHFIWQGTVLALVAGLLMRWLAPSASSRYIVGISALAMMAEAPVITFVVLLRSNAVPAWLPRVDLDTSHIQFAVGTSAQTTWLMPLVLGAWSLGVVVLSLRLLGGWMVARRLIVRAVEPASAEIHAIAQRVADRLRLRRLARIVESSAVSVPVVIGWMKPVVLLPAAALSGLTLAQVESLLAHELAHVRRHDYLVNILQSILETALFYHPGVWWLSKRVRIEREHCCDDLAVSMCDRVVYVSALTDMATLSMTGAPKLALGATDGPLLSRVRRILGGTEPVRPTSGWVAIGALALVIAGVAPVAMASARVQAPATTTSRPAATSGSAPVVEATQVYPLRPESTSVDDAKRRFAEAEEQIAKLNAEREALEHGRMVKELDLKIERAREEMTSMEAALREAKAKADIDATKFFEANAKTARHNYGMAVADREFQAALADIAKRQRAALVQAGRAQDDMQMKQAAEDRARQARGVAGTISEQERRQPRVIKHVSPAYPAIARAARMQGLVIMEALVRKDGTVGSVKVVRSAGVLDEAAMAAVRQWIFEPSTVDGKPVDVVTTVTVNFTLAGSAEGGAAADAVVAGEPEVQAPTLPKVVTRVQAQYTKEAMDAKIQGTVYLETVIQHDGTVGKVVVISGLGHGLDEAAVEAARKWTFVPAHLNNKPVDTTVALEMRFTLK